MLRLRVLETSGGCYFYYENALFNGEKTNPLFGGVWDRKNLSKIYPSLRLMVDSYCLNCNEGYFLYHFQHCYQQLHPLWTVHLKVLLVKQ